MWTSEELGTIGANQYIQNHAEDNKNLQFVIESDLGTFEPVGLEFSGDETVQCVLRKIMKSVSPANYVVLISRFASAKLTFAVIQISELKVMEIYTNVLDEIHLFTEIFIIFLFYLLSGKQTLDIFSIYRLMARLGDMKLKSPCTGPDISYWINAGVPGGSLWTKSEKYFYYHHTNADTMLVENPKALDMNTAMFAALSFVLADISIDLPRHNYTNSYK